MLTSSGLRCDVCGEFILPIFHEAAWFHCTAFKDALCCHCKSCKPAILAAAAEDDIALLPEGPMRTALVKATAERESDDNVIE